MEIDRIRGVIAQMKLQEKIALIGGETETAAIDRLRVPSIELGEGVLRYSAEEPSALALGCTFSPALCASVSKMRSLDAARARKAFAGVIGCGLIQDPMRFDACELFSEDSYLAAELLRSYASAGVIGYVFTDALGQGRYANRTVDSRALNELYLYPLEKAGKYAAALQLDGGYLNGQKVSVSRSVCELFTKYIPQYAMLITQEQTGCGEEGASGCGAYQLGIGSHERKAIMRAVVDGKLIENKLNNDIERTVSTVARTYEFYKKPFPRDAEPVNVVVDSTVLLKNDGLLPLSSHNIAVFGDAAAFDDGSLYKIWPIKDAAKKSAQINLFLITDYADGIAPADAQVISSVGASAKVIVAICGGGAAELPFEKNANAILYCPYCPTVSAVFGMITNTSPRGHLPFSWARSEKSYPRNNEKFKERGDFRYESVYNGYRLFNSFTSDVLYPFGHGLDYTNYDISRFEVSCSGSTVSVDFVIKNNGPREGVALCQVYMTQIGGAVYGFSKRLVAFRRVALEATENAQVRFEIDMGDFPVYDEAKGEFVQLGGKFRLDLGLSSADIRNSAEIKLAIGSRVTAGLSETLAPSYYKAGTGVRFEPTAPEIERLLKVPFIKKPDVYEDILPPPPQEVKGAIKRAEKTVLRRLQPRVKYKIANTPIRK